MSVLPSTPALVGDYLALLRAIGNNIGGDPQGAPAGPAGATSGRAVEPPSEPGTQADFSDHALQEEAAADRGSEKPAAQSLLGLRRPAAFAPPDRTGAAPSFPEKGGVSETRARTAPQVEDAGSAANAAIPGQADRSGSEAARARQPGQAPRSSLPSLLASPMDWQDPTHDQNGGVATEQADGFSSRAAEPASVPSSSGRRPVEPRDAASPAARNERQDAAPADPAGGNRLGGLTSSGSFLQVFPTSALAFQDGAAGLPDDREAATADGLPLEASAPRFLDEAAWSQTSLLAESYEPARSRPGSVLHTASSDPASSPANQSPASASEDDEGLTAQSGIGTALGADPEGLVDGGTTTGPVGEATVSAAAAQDALVESALAALGLGAVDAVLLPLPERAGVIASFILNAHFIPGWPPPRPIEGTPLGAVAARLRSAEIVPALTQDELEKFLYLANLGLAPGQLDRLLSIFAKAKLRRKLLDAILLFLTNLRAALDAVRDELGALAEEFAGEAPVAVAARTAKRREKLSLR